jgi:hypothetical protein
MKVETLKSDLPEKYQDVAHYLEHVLDALERLHEEHMRLTGAYALQGYKVSGENERVFNETISLVKQQLVDTFEKTVEDIRHKGDKHWEKNFNDGVD